MRTLIGLLAALCFTPAQAAERITVTGEAIDTWCYFSGVMGGADAVVGSAHHTCALWCAAGGIPVGILAEDGTVMARDTSVVNLRAGYRLSGGVELALDVFNLLDSGDPDISYYFASCVPGDPAAACGAAPRRGVDDIHAHPVEPRTIRGTLTWRF